MFRYRPERWNRNPQRCFDAIRRIALEAGNEFPEETEDIIRNISGNGGTPLVVSINGQIAGVIELQDIIKPGIEERFERLRKMGVKTVMVTGDNPLTAKYIAEKPEWTISLQRPNRKTR